MKTLIAFLALFLTSGCAFTAHENSWEGKISPAHRALSDLAKSSNRPISVVVLGDVGTTYSADAMERGGLDLSAWKRGALESTRAWIEQSYLEYLRPYRNARLVDRAATDQVAAELKLSLSGAISEEVRVKIGQLTGANYLVIFYLMNSPTGKTSTRTDMTVRLVSVETGQLLASEETRTSNE